MADTASPAGAAKALAHDLDVKALRWSLWLSLLHAQRLHLHDLQHRLTTTLVEVDALFADDQP